MQATAFAEDFDYSRYRTPSEIRYDFSNYMSQVNSKIQKNWSMPEVIEQGQVTVLFKIDKNGEIVSTDIEKSSGNLLFDESAIQAVKASAPFEAIPDEAQREYISIKYNFEASMVKTDEMKELVRKSEEFTNINNKMALYYLDQAIKEIQGDSASYFLYARRYKINKAIGNNEEAEADLSECKRLKQIYDKKRINTCKIALENDPTPFAYFSLANAYDMAGDYQNAIANIDRAINMTELNHQYKRYRAEIMMRQGQ